MDSISTSASAYTKESFVSTEIYSENHNTFENPSASSNFSSGIYSNKNEKSPNSSIKKSTPDFTVKEPLHEPTPLKVAATTEKLDPIQSGVRENIIEFNQENVFILEENKNLSKTSKILEKIIDNDKLVHLYYEARKKLKSIKTNENILTYRNIVAKLEVKILPLCSTLKKQLKDIENETLRKSDTIMLKPESGPSRVYYEKIVNKLKLIAVIRKELKI